MNLRRASAIVLRYYFLLSDSGMRVIQIFVWSALDIVLWGFITKYLASISATFAFVPAFLGAVMLWEFLSRVQQGISTPFLEDVWSRNLLNFFASPLRVCMMSTAS
jgi:ABC-2 type transport system permease protein